MREDIRINIIRVVIISVAVAFIIVGIRRGEPGEIIRKAVVVCLECIRIG